MMKRRILAFLGALLVLLALAPTAQACSCFRGDPRTQLDSADGAFIGRLTSVDPAPPNAHTTTYHFKVDDVFKGDIGETVDVRSSTNGASCGFEVQRGQQMGFFLEREGSTWTGGLCGQVAPDDLRKAAAPYPEPDGSGSLALLVGGRWGEVRTLGVDAQGKTLRYGKGDGWTKNLSTCPGSRVAAEVVRTFDADTDERRLYLVLRDLETFGGINKVLLEGLEAPGAGHYPLDVGALSCRSASGDDVVFFAANNEADQTAATGTLVRVRPDGQSVLWEGGLGGTAAIPTSGGKAYIATRTDKLIEVDLTTAAVRDIATTAGSLESGPVVSPDLRRVAMARPREGGIDLYDIRTGEVKTDRGISGYPKAWISDDRLVLTGAPNNGVVVLDGSLEKVGSWNGWTGDRSAISIAGTLYGTNYEGKLVSAPALTGPTKELRTFDSPELDVLAVVPPKPADPRPVPTTSEQPSARPTTAPTTEPSSEPSPSPAGFAAPSAEPAEPTGSSALPAAALGVSALALGSAAFTWRRRTG